MLEKEVAAQRCCGGMRDGPSGICNDVPRAKTCVPVVHITNFETAQTRHVRCCRSRGQRDMVKQVFGEAVAQTGENGQRHSLSRRQAQA